MGKQTRSLKKWMLRFEMTCFIPLTIDLEEALEIDFDKTDKTMKINRLHPIWDKNPEHEIRNRYPNYQIGNAKFL